MGHADNDQSQRPAQRRKRDPGPGRPTDRASGTDPYAVKSEPKGASFTCGATRSPIRTSSSTCVVESARSPRPEVGLILECLRGAGTPARVLAAHELAAAGL